MLDTSANTARRLTGPVETHDKGEQCLETEPHTEKCLRRFLS